MDNATTNHQTLSQCYNCEKTSTSLKRCAKCKTATYCDRECQTSHWKLHKKECSRLAGISDPASSEREASEGATKRSDNNPFSAIHQGTFLHNKSEHETFKILIDVIRMRQEDTYVFEGDLMTGTIYNQERSSAKALRSFLRRARRVNGFLPPWWTDEKTKECVRFGLDDAHGSLLKCAQEKSDIQEAWKDDRMPMKLRMLGEAVYGDSPGGAPGGRDSMLAMMMQMESGLFNGAMSSMSLNPPRR